MSRFAAISTRGMFTIACQRHDQIVRLRLGVLDRLLDERAHGVQSVVMRGKARLLLSTLFASSPLTVNPAKKPRRASTRAERKQSARSATDTKRYLDPAELARLLAEIPARFRTLVHLMARVGLRPGEAFALRIGKFDPLKHELVIDTAASGDTKTGESRVITLPGIVVGELVAYITAIYGEAP